MLSQSTIQLWEGYYSARGVVPFRGNHHVDIKGASCSAPKKSFSLQRRRRGTTGRRFHHRSISVVVCSQGIQSAPVEPVSEFGSVRASEGGANHLRLDDDDVRIYAATDARSGHEGLDCEESVANGSTSSGRRLSLRSPAPLPEGSRPDSEALEDTSDLGSSPDVEPSDVIAEPEAPKNSFERFVRARAAGRELVKRTKEGQGLGFVTEEYYTPRIGDYVMGIVASGNFGRLDIDIGAKELGHLFRKDVMPLDLCNAREMAWEPQNSPVFAPPHRIRVVHDEEVLNLAPVAPLAVELGTVLAMVVKEMTPSGRALLSARSVAREYAWQRVRQLNEYNATLEVQITEWTTAGLVTKIEVFICNECVIFTLGGCVDANSLGLRAFLPTYYLVNHVPEPSTLVSVSYKEYVGQKFTVMISSVDEKRSNVVISEKKAWMARNAYVGALIEGVVTEIQPYGVHLRIKDTDISGVLHISNISRARVDNIANVFSIGEDVKAMVVPSHSKKRLSFSTADLETDHGLILIDKEAVFKGAERIAAEIAKAYKNKQSNSVVDNNDRVEEVDQEIVIANWDWLEFFDNSELD